MRVGRVRSAVRGAGRARRARGRRYADPVASGARAQAEQRLPQRPPTCPGPGGVVEGDRLPEHLPGRVGQERPGDDEVAGRVADRRRPEVEDRGQPPAPYQQVADRDVAVHPDRRGVPGGRPRCVPHRGEPVDRHSAAEVGEARARLRVVHAEVAAAVEAVCSGERPAAGVDAAQRDEEAGQVGRELLPRADPVGRGGLAGQPAVHRPRVREARPGTAVPDRHRDRQWQPRPQLGQPPLLLAHRGGVRRVAGQPHGQLGAEPVGAVVPAVDLHRPHRQPRPLRELRGHQPLAPVRRRCPRVRPSSSPRESRRPDLARQPDFRLPTSRGGGPLK